MAFASGVSERPDVTAAPILERIYYIFGFIRGWRRLGTPVGGPTWAQAMMWTAFSLHHC